MVAFTRPLLSSALKDNPHLQLAVMTGCLRISKESIFAGLNNLEVISILSDLYSEHFGFTQGEMDAMLAYYGLQSKTQIIKDWYNGYLFGNTEVYNPWSSVNVVNNWTVNINRPPEPHWTNTSSNDIVRDLIDRASNDTKTDLETLMAGNAISKVIHEDITHKEIDDDIDNLWNFLFFTGYLKKAGESVDYMGRIVVDMKIPNRELGILFEDKIQQWFKKSITQKDHRVLFNAIINGDAETFQAELSTLLANSISYMDSAENSYHGFMSGMLVILAQQNGYMVKSNRESGNGRYDLVLYRLNGDDSAAIIFEFKITQTFNQLSTMCDIALRQIESNNYAADWNKDGYKNIIKYGIGFYGKRCKIRKG